MKQISDKNIAEFNYKLLNDLLCNDYYLSKWKICHTLYCKVCPADIKFNHTSWVAVATPTDRPKSVRNRCLIEHFCGVVCVETLPF